MRVLIVDTFYRSFTEELYAAEPTLASRPYDEQWRSLMGSFFGSADSYSHWLAAAGHEAHEFVVNCPPLQRAWAREHGLRPSLLASLDRAGVDERIVLAQIEDFRPDVVYVQNLHALSARTLRRIRRERLLVGQIASELPPPERLGLYELIVTSFVHYAERLPRAGIAAAYLPLSFDPRVLDHVGTDGPRAGAVFVGSLGRNQHGAGNALLEQVAAAAPLRVWGSSVADWDAASPLRRAYQGPAWGLGMYRILAAAAIAFNRHIDVAEDYANNMRLFEATGTGALLITDEKRNLAQLFDPGREVVTYRDAADAAAKIRHYLEHPDEAATIARAGQARTLRDHTSAQRMADLAALLESRL